MEENPEYQMKLEEELVPIELFPNKIGFYHPIETQMTNKVSMAVIYCLRRNAIFFAFSPNDIIEIDQNMALCCLNVDPQIMLVKQKMRLFGPGKHKIIKE